MFSILNLSLGTCLAVQWLRFRTFTARGTGSIPGQGTKIPHAVRCSQKLKKTKNKKTYLLCTQNPMQEVRSEYSCIQPLLIKGAMSQALFLA